MTTENREEMPFADLTADTTFKKTFANEKDKEPLIVLLNVFLEKVLAYPIVDVNIKNPYVQGQTVENRDSVFDILCEDSAGNRFLVEVQVGWQAYFIKRVLFYVCMAIANDAKKGAWNFNYPPVYSLSFLSFDLDDFRNDDVVQHLGLSNIVHPEIRYNFINMVFVRLTKFDKALSECETLQDKLLFSLCNAHKLKGKPEQFGEEVFEKIFDVAKICKFTPSERAKYEANMMNKRDQYASNVSFLNKGQKEGIAIGREEVFTLLESGVPLAEAKRMLGVNTTNRP